MTFRFFIFLFILGLIDLYVFQGFRVLFKNIQMPLKSWLNIGFWSIFAVTFFLTLYNLIFDIHSLNQVFRTYLVSVLVIVYFSKIVVVPFLLADDLFRLVRFGLKWMAEIRNPESGIKGAEIAITRSDFLVRMGFVAGAIPAMALLHGMFGNAYKYTVRNIQLTFTSLPKSFHGLRIVQISDLHLGSFFDGKPLEKAVEEVIGLKPDIIVMTGDLVNYRAEEAKKFLPVLRKLSAPLGVFSILGNHDYGDYVRWESAQEKKENMENLRDTIQQAGWNLLLNENKTISKNNESISILGCENWSSFGRFPKYGNMPKTLADAGAEFKILLSHDPSHWEGEILKKYENIALTLSGHTHGMQFGIEIPGFKWSPVQYFYKQWAGLYEKNQQYLYVNRGLGFIGYPGRVGIMPEITFIELLSGH